MSATEARPWDIFRLADYRLLWCILLASGLGLWLRILGTAQWLLNDTGSAMMVGLIGVVQLVVQIPALLWGGTLADRIDRKRLMTGAHGITCSVMATLGVLNLLGALSPPLVYLGIALTAASQMFANPSRSALVAAVVPADRLMRAASTDNATGNTAAILGPLLFAALSVSIGLTAAFLTGAALSFTAMVLPRFVSAPGQAAEREAGSTLTQTIAGLRYVAKHPILPGLFLLDTGITVVSFYREILPVLALGMFAAGAEATGLLGAANSVGAVLGSFVALALAGYRAKGMLVLYATLAYALVLFAFGMSEHLWLGVVLIALIGAADSVTVTVRHTTVMLTTPDAMRGRAFSIMVLAAQTANNVGTIWVGYWAGAIGAGQSLALGGVLSLIATVLIGWWWRPIRTYRSP
ncbi:MAG TPA: MFS transporter [Pseudomonadales bacterium]|nr:MFS transporter [Pseudomonadales bacterium]